MAADAITPTTLPRLLTRRDLAAMLGVCLRTVERLDLEGRGPDQTRIGKGVRYHPDDVERWLEERRQRRRSA